MIRARLFKQGDKLEEGGAELLDSWKKDRHSRIWIDLQGESVEQQRAFLEQLQCHPLAINDALRERHPPKVEEFGQHTLIIYRGMASLDEHLNYEPRQIVFFLFERMLVSLHAGSAKSIEQMWSQHIPYLHQKTVGEWALKTMHTSSGFYLESLLAFENQLSDLEDELLTRPTDTQMKTLTVYKSQLVKLRRVFNYHLAITHELSSYDYHLLPRENPEILHAINDLYERFERLHSLAQMYYDISGDLVEGYISLSSHQLNNTMRILTVITAIFVPLTFLAGIYGMNFEHMPELAFKYAYFVLLGVMGVMAAALVWLFKRNRWL